MHLKTLPVLLFAVLPLMTLAQVAPPAAPPVQAAEATAPAPDATAAAVATTPAAPDQGTAAEAASAGDNPTVDTAGPGMRKRICDMKGKGAMAGSPMGHRCGCPGPGCDPARMHKDLAERLDLIEVHLAKIDAMLESLMRR